MKRSCPRCGAVAGDGAYCRQCKFFVGFVPRSEKAREGGLIVAPITSEEVAERSECIRCGASVSHALVCRRCKSEMQYHMYNRKRRW